MNRPLSYYGGKYRLIPEILPLIPAHKQYGEIFAGGLSVYYAKAPSDNEFINDVDGDLTNFYWQLKTNFQELQKLIQATLHSEIHYIETKKVLVDPNETPVRRAWAYWVQTQMCFSFIKGGGFAFGDTGSGGNTANKRDNFTHHLSERMRATEIFNRDALELIDLKCSSPDTLIFCDPPYVSSDQGGYKGYTMEDFEKLLKKLSELKCKFILSSYPEPILMEYREKYKWNFKDLKQVVGVSGKREDKKYKIECITYNFETPNKQVDIFSQVDQTSEPESSEESNETETQ